MVMFQHRFSHHQQQRLGIGIIGAAMATPESSLLLRDWRMLLMPTMRLSAWIVGCADCLCDCSTKSYHDDG